MDSTKEIYLSALYITNDESRNTPLQQAFGQNQVVRGGAWKSRLDEAHQTLSGPATKKLLQRACYTFHETRFQRLARISVGPVVPTAGESRVP